MSEAITPTRISWTAPEMFGVTLNEDGVHLTYKGALCMEECDLDVLLRVIAEAKRVREAKSAPTPAPPTGAALRYAPGAYHARRAERAAVEGIRKAYADETNETNLPF